jgi:predicted unusual protein kinase regulating ubiquinone biosynthesis (AarF/ABC1/UbiB family)
VHKARLLSPGRWLGAPKDGIVAVKVQYPDALETMLQDLSNIRVAARFLQVRIR